MYALCLSHGDNLSDSRRVCGFVQFFVVMLRDVLRVWDCFGIIYQMPRKRPDRQLTTMSAGFAGTTSNAGATSYASNNWAADVSANLCKRTHTHATHQHTHCLTPARAHARTRAHTRTLSHTSERAHTHSHTHLSLCPPSPPPRFHARAHRHATNLLSSLSPAPPPHLSRTSSLQLARVQQTRMLQAASTPKARRTGIKACCMGPLYTHTG